MIHEEFDARERLKGMEERIEFLEGLVKKMAFALLAAAAADVYAPGYSRIVLIEAEEKLGLNEITFTGTDERPMR
jgi:hypothetical protein